MKALLLLLALAPLSSYAVGVTAYFNHTANKQYTEPYRNITRTGDNLEQVLLDQITSAKKSIYIAVLEFRLPLVAKALVAKKAQGVDVRVVLEHDYNFNVTRQTDETNDNEHDASRSNELHAFVDVNRNGRFEVEELQSRDAIYILQQAQIPIMDDTFDSSAGSGLMHHKFMIIDGRTTVVSSANFTMSCIHGDSLAPNSRGNANSMIVVDSPGFSGIFTEEFSQLWGNGRRGNYGQGKTYRGPRSITVGGIKMTVQFSPTSRKYNWEETVNGLIGAQIKRATKSVKAALFVYSDQNLSTTLEARSDAGVAVGVLMERQFAFREYSELLDMLGVRMLAPNCKFEDNNQPWRKPVKEAGVGVQPQGDVLHHKFGVVDNKITIMGSQNWSDSANFSNDETLVVIENAAISDQYTQEYNRLLSNSQLGAPAWLRAEISRRENGCANQGFHY